MAVTVSTGSATVASQDTSAHTVTYRLTGGYSGNDLGYTVRSRNMILSGSGTATIAADTTAVSDSFASDGIGASGNRTIAADTSTATQAWIDHEYDGNVFGSNNAFKSKAEVATASAPTTGSITSSSALVSADFVPKVTASTCSAQLQYKKTVDSIWINFGTPKTDGTGYTTSSITNESLTGLDSSTSYDLRLVLTRTTANDTTTTSSTTSFNTLAGEPEVTSDAATSVSANSATLNLTLDINAGTGVTVYWKWGTDNPPTQNTTASQGASADGSFGVGISGLSGSTTYYHQAYTEFSTPSGSPNTGSVANFTTLADPSAEAADEDHVITPTFFGKYGVAKTITFTLRSPAATSSDLLYTSTAPLQADVLIFKDGVFDATSDNAPAQVSTYLYTLELSATEMTAEVIDVVIHDASATAFRDQHIRVQTILELSEVDIDAAAGTKANTTAFRAVGYGSGHGISAVAGATGSDIDGVLAQHIQRFNTAQAGGASTITLDASASATNDYYNGSLVTVVGGTGAGQSRVITDYVGSTKVATVHKAWATNPSSDSVFVISAGDDSWAVSPGAELSALPTYASAYGALLQFLFQRFVYKRTQTATVFTMYKDDGSTTLASGGTTDNGTTQTHAELS